MTCHSPRRRPGAAGSRQGDGPDAAAAEDGHHDGPTPGGGSRCAARLAGHLVGSPCCRAGWLAGCWLPSGWPVAGTLLPALLIGGRVCRVLRRGPVVTCRAADGGLPLPKMAGLHAKWAEGRRHAFQAKHNEMVGAGSQLLHHWKVLAGKATGTAAPAGAAGAGAGAGAGKKQRQQATPGSQQQQQRQGQGAGRVPAAVSVIDELLLSSQPQAQQPQGAPAAAAAAGGRKAGPLEPPAASAGAQQQQQQQQGEAKEAAAEGEPFLAFESTGAQAGREGCGRSVCWAPLRCIGGRGVHAAFTCPRSQPPTPASPALPAPARVHRPAACGARVALAPAGDWRRDAAIQVLMMALHPMLSPLAMAVELEQQLWEDYRNAGGGLGPAGPGWAGLARCGCVG